MDSLEKYEFAFYLHMNGDVIEKIWYTASSTAEFSLKINGIYFITAFSRLAGSKEVQIIKSEPVRFVEGRKPSIMKYMHIEEMEMTNICNLQCDNCCTPTTNYPRGFMDDRTVLATLSWTKKGQTLNYHRQGEPLLHKQLEKYVRWGVEAEIKPIISTNGELLDVNRLEKLYAAGLRHLVITLHTEGSLKSYLNVIRWLEEKGVKTLHFSEHHKPLEEDVFYFAGKVLDFADGVEQSKEVRGKIESLGENEKRFLQITPVHTWAGNVADKRQDFSDDIIKQRQTNCYFIQTPTINVRWDGTVVGCCFDSENDNEIGHILDFSDIIIDLSKYKLCEHCDSNWAVQ